jgi:hypothetical protein
VIVSVCAPNLAQSRANPRILEDLVLGSCSSVPLHFVKQACGRAISYFRQGEVDDRFSYWWCMRGD